MFQNYKDEESSSDEEEEETEGVINIEFDDENEEEENVVDGFGNKNDENDDDEDEDEELEVFGEVQKAPKKLKIKKNNKKINSENSKEIKVITDEFFNVTYTPYKIPQQSQQQKDEFEDEIVSYPARSANNNEEENDEFEFEFEANVSCDPTTKFDIISRINNSALNKLKESKSSEGVNEDINNLSVEVEKVSIDKISILEAAGKSLQEITEAYENGLGDVEVRMLNNSSENTNKKIEKINMKELNAISEEDENEDENDLDTITESQMEKMKNDDINEQMKLWQEVETNSVNKPNNDTRIEEDVYIPMNFKKLFNYLNNLKLQNLYGNQISTHDEVEESSDSTGGTQKWLKAKISSFMSGSGNSRLDFDPDEEQLSFPFLVAQLDFDFSIREHKYSLQAIYYKLTNKTHETFICPDTGPHWEEIGFQGLDPRTDLNRAMKMLTIFSIHIFLDQHPRVIKLLYALSLCSRDSPSSPSSPAASPSMNSAVSRAFGKATKGPKTIRAGGDLSWPFMCVAVMLTRVALQALRAGRLAKQCTERQTVLPVFFDFFMSLFHNFGRMLVNDPDTHHATHLSNLQKQAESSPSHIFSMFFSALKSGFPDSSLTHKNISSNAISTSPERAEFIKFVDLSSNEEPQTDVKNGIFSTDKINSMFKVGKKSKFIVS